MQLVNLILSICLQKTHIIPLSVHYYKRFNLGEQEDLILPLPRQMNRNTAVKTL